MTKTKTLTDILEDDMHNRDAFWKKKKMNKGFKDTYDNHQREKR